VLGGLVVHIEVVGHVPDGVFYHLVHAHVGFHERPIGVAKFTIVRGFGTVGFCAMSILWRLLDFARRTLVKGHPATLASLFVAMDFFSWHKERID
jgi:hypothetical protein